MCLLASLSLLLLHSFLLTAACPSCSEVQYFHVFQFQVRKKRSPWRTTFGVSAMFAISACLSKGSLFTGWLPNSHYYIGRLTPAMVDWTRREHLIQIANQSLSPHILIHFKSSRLIQSSSFPLSTQGLVCLCVSVTEEDALFSHKSPPSSTMYPASSMGRGRRERQKMSPEVKLFVLHMELIVSEDMGGGS